MSKKKRCGGCINFTKWRNDQVSGRAGLCDHFDFGVKTDDWCDYYRAKKYSRKDNKKHYKEED